LIIEIILDGKWFANKCDVILCLNEAKSGDNVGHWRALCTSAGGLASRCAGILQLNKAKITDNA
jgi:hypothetical protein